MTAVRATQLTETPETTRFGVLEVTFDSRVLRPRPWTVIQAEWAAEVADLVPAGPILELCSGAGHIGQLAAALSGRPLVQVDADPSACRFAQLNAERPGASGDVEIRCGPMTTAVRPNERFPIIIADPPYIPSAHVGRFPEDPPAAIDGGVDGLQVIRECLDVARRHLFDDGACLLQVRGPSQLAALGPLVDRRSFVVRDARIADDDRAVALVGRKAGTR